MKKLLVIVLAVMALVGGLIAADGDNTLPYSWAAPTDGSPVVYYIGEMEVNGEIFIVENIEGATVTLPRPDNGTMRLRVAGIDSQGRQGPFSGWSEAFTDLGAPGAPGVPVLVE